MKKYIILVGLLAAVMCFAAPSIKINAGSVKTTGDSYVTVTGGTVENASTGTPFSAVNTKACPASTLTTFRGPEGALDALSINPGSNLGSTLPVELSSFTATINAFDSVQLQWITQSETNVSGFRIYRSRTEALETAEMLNVFIPASNTSQTQSYVFTDTEPTETGYYYYWLENVDLNGGNNFYGPVQVNFESPDGGSPSIPVIPGINSIYPNPFNPDTNIRVGIGKDAFTTIMVYNTRGQLVRTLMQQNLAKGSYTVGWDGKDNNRRSCSSGVYMIRMLTGKESYSSKVMLLK